LAKFIFALGGLGELGIRAEVLFEVAVGTRVAPRPPHRSRRAELTRPEAVEFFLRLHGLWEGLVNIPPPPDAPFDIDTFEPIDPPWPAIREWIPADATDPLAVFPEDILSTHWVPKEIRLDDERTLVIDPS
jgi:hypothetical protein